MPGKSKHANNTHKDKEEVPLHDMKHPLENTWKFWMFTNKTKNWMDSMVHMTTFNTVEDYWCLYHHMKVPSELKLGQDYFIFKEGIQPMWEDEANKRGGRWLTSHLRESEMDSVWLDTVLLVIGENFLNSDIICGVTVNVRTKSKVCVWTSTTDKSKNMEIGHKIKQKLTLKQKLQYQKHNTSTYLYTI